ncbi:MAG: hypothetical protein LE180_04185, partial [Endomicrobium sp.]|uniref:hypothetical protein n=1 Tax=Candidatus Endomicrobiellum pyrsonymphae TaxID=1408203 RepID=UPI00358BC6DE|nr:hypothetical protein [Endomicrobium sp.]
AKKVEDDNPKRPSTPLVLTEEELKETKAVTEALVEREEIWAMAEAVRKLREERKDLSVADVDESTKEIALARVRELGATEVDKVIMEIRNLEETITRTAMEKTPEVIKKLLEKEKRERFKYNSEEGVERDAMRLISCGDVVWGWDDVEGDKTLTRNTEQALFYLADDVSLRMQGKLKEKLMGKDWEAKVQVTEAKATLANVDPRLNEENKAWARATLARLAGTEAATHEQIVLAGATNVVVEKEVRIWAKDKMNIKVLEMMRAMTKVAFEAMRNAMKKK